MPHTGGRGNCIVSLFRLCQKNNHVEIALEKAARMKVPADGVLKTASAEVSLTQRMATP